MVEICPLVCEKKLIFWAKMGSKLVNSCEPERPADINAAPILYAYMTIPDFLVGVDHHSSETTGRVDSCPGYQNYSSIDDESLNVRISDEIRKENRDCNNGEKQGSSEEVKMDTVPNKVQNGINDIGKHTKPNKIKGSSRFKSYTGATINNQNEVDKKIVEILERITKKRTKNKAKTTKPDWVKEIIDFNNGVYFIKFHHNEGLIMLLTMGLGCRVGKPMVMDHITATLCNKGVGRFRFARVMLKVSTSKHLPGEIEMVYKCRKRNVEGATATTNKNVNVESNMGVGDKQSVLKVDSEGFTAVHNKKGRVVTKKVLRPNFKPNTQQPKGVASTKGVMSEKANPQFTYQPKKKDGGISNIPPDKLELNENDKLKRPVDSKEKSPNKKAWSVHGEILSAVKRSADDEQELSELNEMKNRKIIDKFISQKKTPSESDMLFWNIDMVAYYKKKRNNFMDQKIGCWNIRGLNTSDKQKEIRKFISEECLSVCAIMETHIQAKRIQKIGDLIYGSAKQSILCEIRTVMGNKRNFCSIVYAANGGMERRIMWKDFMIYKRIMVNDAWFLMGDMNVILFPNEHSAGCSHMTSDMSDFRDCVNNIEVEDIASSGLFYTWIKNLFKVKTGDTSGVLKKLDRMMGNEEFIHNLQLKKRAFKFANLVAAKKEFIPIIMKHWNEDHDGFRMVKKDQLSDVQSKIDKNPKTKQLREDESRILADYLEAMKDEEKLAVQVKKLESIDSLINNKLCDKDAADMIRGVSNEEIKSAMFSINSNKAPDPDGFSSYFFKKTRSTMGDDVCKAVREFFNNGKILREINSTLISLVLKIQTPMNWQYMKAILKGFGFHSKMRLKTRRSHVPLFVYFSNGDPDIDSGEED
ncbi:RNA-directed DNA polymerase, eukaryota, reverse transcriptase zinc-binding domain protein [Tanacetum coccineum]